MPIGQVRTLACSATAPRTITGNRQVFTVTAKANPNSLGPEGAATANNTGTASTAVETCGDLDPTWSGSPTSVNSGQETVFRATMRNTGDGAVGASVLRISIPLGQVSFVRFDNNRFSNGCGQPDAQGKLSCRTSSLAAGASVSVGIVTRTNPLLIAGDRLLLQASADTVSTANFDGTTGSVPLPPGIAGRTLKPSERSTSNNSASLVTTVTSAPLDLVVTPVTGTIWKCHPSAYRCLAMQFRVENRGPGTYVGGTQVRIDKKGLCGSRGHLERGSCVPGPGPTGCQSTDNDQTCPVGNLAPGECRTIAFTVWFPPEGAVNPPGLPESLTVTARVDPTNTIPETNENNNRATVTRHY